jgi:predicted Zn-ribbon and HTH transcriptional regulator
METSNIAPAEVADIFRIYGEQYRKKYNPPKRFLRAMNAIMRCRTSALGSHKDKCDKCGHVNIHHNSCRNRHCPKCQGLNQIKWADRLAAALLPVKYFHIVFTIPEELNRLTLVNQECMYNILFKAVSDTILMLAKDKKHIGVNTGLVAVLHTWGQNLMDHPHLHIMVPAGGLDPLSQYWKYSPKNFFIPVKVLSRVFRGKFLALLKKAYKDKQLTFAGEIAPLRQVGNFKQLLDTVYKKEWVVNSQRSSSKTGGAQIIEYMARYSHRVAISNDRILGIEDDQVAFTWKDNKDKGKQKVMHLDGVEFIRRFMLHILPDSFCKIRYYGIFASCKRTTVLKQIKKDLGRKAVKAKYTGLPWNEVVLLLTGNDPLQCPKCKAGRMIQFEVITALQARMSPT